MQLDRGFVRRLCLAALLVASAACDDSEPETSSETKAVANAPAVCNKTPIDQRGTLPACAAGTPTVAGPGVPDDHTGPKNAPLTLTAEEISATAAAEQQSALRGPPGVDPVDLGFGRPPARPQPVTPKASAE